MGYISGGIAGDMIRQNGGLFNYDGGVIIFTWVNIGQTIMSPTLRIARYRGKLVLR